MRLALSLATAVALYLAFQVTLGGTWDHNRALDDCARTPIEGGHAPAHAEVGIRDRWTWWPPGHAHLCVYRTLHSK